MAHRRKGSPLISLRTLAPDDLPHLMHWKRQAHWNQLAADARRMIELAASGGFVALWHGRPAGCVLTFRFGGVAWIAMMLVEEELQGRGIGRALMTAALDMLDGAGVSSIRLDATPQGEPLYRSLGFAAQYSLHRFAGIVAGVQSAEASLARGIPPEAEILELDRELVRCERAPFLTRILAEHPGECRWLASAGGLEGYSLARPGANAWQLGPCLASTESAGHALFADLLARNCDRHAYVDIPQDNVVAQKLVQDRGLAVQRTLLRMCRGKPSLEVHGALWASAGPEKG